MFKRLFVLAVAVLTLGVASDASAQIKYKVYHNDLTINVLRCFVQSDGSCVVDFLMENNSMKDWKIKHIPKGDTGHKNRAYDDMGNSYSSILVAIGSTDKYLQWGYPSFDFPEGVALKVRAKIDDISEIATVIKRLDLDIISRQWTCGDDAFRKPITIMNIPISR